MQADCDPLATAVLLGVLYTLRAQITERDTLRLVWGCTLTVSAVSALLNLGAYSLMDYDWTTHGEPDCGRYALVVHPAPFSRSSSGSRASRRGFSLGARVLPFRSSLEG